MIYCVTVCSLLFLTAFLAKTGLTLDSSFKARKATSIPSCVQRKRKHEPDHVLFIPNNSLASTTASSFDCVPPSDSFDFHHSSKPAWLRGFRAGCIPIEGREDIMVVVITNEGEVLRTEVVPAPTEDEDPTSLGQQEVLHLPGWRHRTYGPDIKHTKEEDGPSSEGLPNKLRKTQYAPTQELEPIILGKKLEEVEEC